MKKIIPPVLCLLCIALMIAMDRLFAFAELIPRPFSYLGFLFILVGIRMTLIVRKQFELVDTEIHTFKKPRRLITDGLFSLSRNPIYVGFASCLLGVWIFLGTLTPGIGFFLFIAITHYWYIPFEEKAMEEEFGQAYNVYKAKVRRWF